MLAGGDWHGGVEPVPPVQLLVAALSDDVNVRKVVVLAPNKVAGLWPVRVERVLNLKDR